MKPLLLVDGYNVIGAWDVPRAEHLTIEESRDRLIHLIADYAGYSGEEVIVVFDGHYTDRPTRSHTHMHGVEVVFTKHAESADNYIEALCQNVPKWRRLRVATSDGTEQMVTMGRGAVRISSREFLMELTQTRQVGRTKARSAAVSRGDIFSRLPPEQQALFDRMRRGEESRVHGGLMEHDFEQMTDEEVALLAQQGNTEAQEQLLNRYKNFVRSKARSYFLVGADHEDIVQEGMIGLFKAFRDYRPDKLASFHAFAEICITRQIITAIKTATRQKHIPLNSYVSLNKPIYEEESERTLMDVLSEGTTADPEELLIGHEDYVSIESRIDSVLSPLERDVLALYLEHKSYQEIAQLLGRHVKSVDNALQRIKHKLENVIEEKRTEN